jgi:hypothetical protein
MAKLQTGRVIRRAAKGSLRVQDEIHDIETDPQDRQPWTAPSLVRLNTGAAEMNWNGGYDGLFES